jgi:transposase
MFIAKALWTNKAGKTYESIWLRESYRQDGKVKTRNLLNLKGWSVDAINSLRNTIKLCNKRNLSSDNNLVPDKSTPNLVDPHKILIKQGLSVGALFTVYQIANRLGIIKALGNTPDGKLALWQICARVLEQGSRLSSARMANFHAVTSILQFEQCFTENDLYDNLHWLDKNQKSIEDRLFALRYDKEQATPNLFLYDVTSSYLEGEKNELAHFGYNRDKKKGKLQIVIGLLCDNNGIPVSIEVFEGNTQDTKTVLSQVKKVRERFGCKKVTFVGDRGMLKSTSLEHLKEADFAYITAITRPQIETLIHSGTIEYSLFDENLCEVECDGIRYIFRRNPVRTVEIQETRISKLNKVKELLEQKNTYLREHSQAQVKTALGDVWKKIEQLKLEKWVILSISQAEPRSLKMSINEEELEELRRLDGCYVLKTDVPKEISGKEEIHERYKDLAQVESAFRTCKTVSLELRPLYVRLATSTRGHVFAVMLAYMIIQELNRLWKGIDITVEEGLTHLSSIVETSLLLPGGHTLSRIPEPSTQSKALLDAAKIKLPAALKNSKAVVGTYSHKKKSH